MGVHSSRYVENHAAKDAIAYVDKDEQHWSSSISVPWYREKALNTYQGATLYTKNLEALMRLRDGHNTTYGSVKDRTGGDTQKLIDDVVMKSAYEIAASQKDKESYDYKGVVGKGDWTVDGMAVSFLDGVAGGKMEHAFTYSGDTRAAKAGIRAFLECETLTSSKKENCPNADKKVAEFSEIRNPVGQRVMDENTAHVKVGKAGRAYKAGEQIEVGREVSVQINGQTFKLTTTADIQFVALKDYQKGDDMGEVWISGVDPRMVALQKLQDAVNTGEKHTKLGMLAVADFATQAALAIAVPAAETAIVVGGIGVNAVTMHPMNEALAVEELNFDQGRSDYFEEAKSHKTGGFMTDYDRDWHTGSTCDPEREFNKDNSAGCAPMNEVIRMNHLEEMPINAYGDRILPDNDKPVNRRPNKPPMPPAPPLPTLRPDPAPRDYSKAPLEAGDAIDATFLGVIGLGVAAVVAVAVR